MVFPGDTPEAEKYRAQLAMLDDRLRAAFQSVRALDPDWKRNERQLLSDAHEAQDKKP